MRERQIPCLLECCYRQLSRNAGEMFNEIVERITTLKIVKQSLKGYPSAGKARRTPHDLSVAGNSGFHIKLRYRWDHHKANRSDQVANEAHELAFRSRRMWRGRDPGERAERLGTDFVTAGLTHRRELAFEPSARTPRFRTCAHRQVLSR
jgi:hypothetical protein